MSLAYKQTVDPANGILICDVEGTASQIIEIEHMMKSVIKMAGKHQLKNLVIDVTRLYTECSNIEIAKLMIDMQQHGFLDHVKIARIVNAENRVHSIIEGFAESLDLPIKNFETRSQAMLWLLYNKAD